MRLVGSSILPSKVGLNVIDTADVYSAGRSEEIVGEVLLGRRDEIVVATKARFAMGSGQNDAGLSRRYLLHACEASLRRLQTDYIDLYQVHQRDGVTPMEETLDALDTLVSQGKVRYVGVSNHSAWHVMKALGISERRGLQRYVTQQIYYSLLDRDAEYEARSALDRFRVGDSCLEPASWSASSPANSGVVSSRRKAPEWRLNGVSHPSTTKSACSTSSTC